eukprot:5884009-Ditylum_brightwellii.AAC.1
MDEKQTNNNNNNNNNNTQKNDLLTLSGDPHEAMYALNLTDGLPVIPPTPSRVKSMLHNANQKQSDVLGAVPPSFSSCTVKHVACASVMAGCAPSTFPIVLAAIKAMLDPTFNLHGLHATTMGGTPCIVVNGPQSKALNSSIGALGSGCRANATIGRALKLVLLNVGGAVCGGSESTTLGTPMKFTMCIAENEDSLRQEWRPLSVERGYNENETIVTVIPVTCGPIQLVDFFTKDANTLISLMAQSLHSVYNAEMPFINDCTIVISPEHLDTLIQGGISSKRQFQTCLWHKCNVIFLSSYIPAVRQFLTIKTSLPKVLVPFLAVILGTILAILQRLRVLMGYDPLTFLPKFSSPDSFHIVVAGGPGGKFTSFMPGFGVGLPSMPTAHMSCAVSCKVEDLPSIQMISVYNDATTKESESIIVDPRKQHKMQTFQLAPRN